MPSSRARTRASRETCFSALSWSSAPTKSRLIMCLLLWLLDGCRVPPTQRNVGWSPTFPGGPALLLESIHRGRAAPQSRRPVTATPEVTSRAARPPGTGSRSPVRRAWPRAGESAGRSDRASPVSRVDVCLEQVDELGDDVVAAERPVELPIDEHGSHRRLEGTGQADPDVRVLGLARPVHDAAHHRDPHVLDARVRRRPL